jgi:hypothetical protein
LSFHLDHALDLLRQGDRLGLLGRAVDGAVQLDDAAHRVDVDVARLHQLVGREGQLDLAVDGGVGNRLDRAALRRFARSGELLLGGRVAAAAAVAGFVRAGGAQRQNRAQYESADDGAVGSHASLLGTWPRGR